MSVVAIISLAADLHAWTFAWLRDSGMDNEQSPFGELSRAALRACATSDVLALSAARPMRAMRLYEIAAFTPGRPPTA